MSARRKVGLWALGTLFLWEFLGIWGLFDSLSAKLRSKGQVGVFIVDVLSSPILRLTLISVAFIWLFR